MGRVSSLSPQMQTHYRFTSRKGVLWLLFPSNARLCFAFGKTKWIHGIILDFAMTANIAEHTERKPVLRSLLGGNLMDCVFTTLQVYRAGFGVVKSGHPVAGSFQPATCRNSPRCWQAPWLHSCSLASLGCGTDMFFIAVSTLFAQFIFYKKVQKDSWESIPPRWLGLPYQMGVLMSIQQERREMKVLDLFFHQSLLSDLG